MSKGSARCLFDLVPSQKVSLQPCAASTSKLGWHAESRRFWLFWCMHSAQRFVSNCWVSLSLSIYIYSSIFIYIHLYSSIFQKCFSLSKKARECQKSARIWRFIWSWWQSKYSVLLRFFGEQGSLHRFSAATYRRQAMSERVRRCHASSRADRLHLPFGWPGACCTSFAAPLT